MTESPTAKPKPSAADATPLSPNVKRAYERDRAQLVKRHARERTLATEAYAKHQANAAALLMQIESIDQKLATSSGSDAHPPAPTAPNSAAGAAAETAPATLDAAQRLANAIATGNSDEMEIPGFLRRGA